MDYAGDDEIVVGTAAEMLSNWPHNFRAVLNELAGLSSAPCSLTTSPLSGMYFRIRQEVRPREEAAFVLDEMTKFSTERFGGRYQAGKLLGDAKRFITRAELAARLGTGIECTNRLVQEAKLSTVRLEVSPKRPKLLVDMSAVQMSSRAPGKVHNTRDAAAIIGISPNMLITIRDLGMFEAKHLPCGIRGFHEKDCEAYRQKLLQYAESGKGEHLNNPAVRLGTILHGRGTNAFTKARVVSEVHSGRISVIGIEGNSVKGLLLCEAALQSFLKTSPNPDWSILRGRSGRNTSNGSGGISTAQAMREIDCSANAMRGLVRAGTLVRANGGRRGIDWILARSVDMFRAEYVSLKSIARELHTNEKVLRKGCKELDIELLDVKFGQTIVGAFVCKKDLSTVRRVPFLVRIVSRTTQRRWEKLAA